MTTSEDRDGTFPGPSTHSAGEGSGGSILEDANQASAWTKATGHDLPADVMNKLLVIYFTHVHVGPGLRTKGLKLTD